MKKFARRHRVGVVASVAMLAVLIASSVAITMLYFDARRARDAKQREKDKVDAMLVEARRTASMRDFREARAKSERGSHAESVAYLCRANRIDPANGIASSYLAAQLAYEHLARQVAPVLTPPEGYDEITRLGVSSAAQQVLVTCVGKKQPPLMLRWSLGDGSMKSHKLAAEARSLLVTSDEQRVMLGLADGHLLECDLRLDRLRTLEPAMNGAITTMSCTPDSAHLICGTSTGQVQLWDLGKLQPAAPAFLARDAVTDVRIGASPDLVLVVGDDKVELFNPLNPAQHSPPLLIGGLGATALQAQGHRLLLGMKTGQAQLRNIDSGKFIGWPLPHRGAVTAATFVSDGELVVTGDAGGGLYGWNTQTGEPTGETVRMDGAVLFCQATPQQGSVLAVSTNGEVRFWEPATESATVHRVRKPLRAATMSRYGTLVALSLRDTPAVLVWEMHGRMIEPRYLPVSSSPPNAGRATMKPSPLGLPTNAPFCWDSAGVRYAMMTSEDTVTVGPAPLRKVRVKGQVKTLALSNDGLQLVTSGSDRNATVWHLAGGQPASIELQHNSAVQHLVFTPDSGRLITATDEGELRCWDVATGEPLMPPVNRGERLKALCIAEQGRMICYERRGGGWFLFPVPQRCGPQPEWFLQVAEALARRHLSESGSVETLSFAAFSKAVAAIPKPKAFVDDLAVRQLSRWLVSDPSRRPLWPDDEGSFPDYLKELVQTQEPAALREVLRFDPLNVTAHEAARTVPTKSDR